MTDPAITSIMLQQARLAEELVELRLQVEKLKADKGKGYLPRQTARWWRDLGEEEAKAELGRVKGWYETVAMRVLGAPKLADCTYAHGACRTVLDTSSELWASCFLPERRTPQLVAAQAEFLTRMWPGLLDLMVRETKNCSHQADAEMARFQAAKR